MLIILNFGIIVVDFGIVVDFDVDISIFVMDYRSVGEKWKHVCLNFDLLECKLSIVVKT
jgi:hypothetical protein